MAASCHMDLQNFPFDQQQCAIKFCSCEYKFQILPRVYLCIFRVRMAASCDMDLRHFPFDQQQCIIKFSSCEYKF